MIPPALALQGAIVTLVKAAATSAGDRVYDDVPGSEHREKETGAAFPYWTVSVAQDIPRNDEADETCGYMPWESIVQLDGWSGGTGYPQVMTMAADVFAAVAGAEPALDGYRLQAPLEVQSMSYERDPDGKTRRARITIRALTQPAG